jgi:hypothetical protein
VNAENKVTKLENINISIGEHNNVLKKDDKRNSDKNSQIYNDIKNLQVNQNQEKEEEDPQNLEYFKENEEKIVYIQSGFRGYKARKDNIKTERKDETDNKSPNGIETKKETKNEENNNNISQSDNPQNANNSKYFEDKEAAEFGKI